METLVKFEFAVPEKSMHLDRQTDMLITISHSLDGRGVTKTKCLEK